jgi:hypothetical protein
MIGFWQSYKYFEKIRTTLLKDFTPKHTPNPKNQDTIHHIQKSESISIHIRRGDFDATSRLEMEYYNKAINYLDKKIKNPLFLVFSNDISRCKANLYHLSNVIFVDRNNANDSYRDMILMSQCKHNIIANSTFSRRGAYLNQNPQKIVIAPKKWLRYTNNLNDLLPPKWIKL